MSELSNRLSQLRQLLDDVIEADKLADSMRACSRSGMRCVLSFVYWTRRS